MERKIFQIGFNRCGTTSLYEFFRKNSIKSVHWERGRLARTIEKNFENGDLLLRGIEEFVFYSDLEWVSCKEILESYKKFELLDQQYSNSLFILNTRNKENWLASRFKSSYYVERYCTFFKINEHQLKEKWSADWEKHHNHVRKYFKNSKRFLELNIEKTLSKL